MREGCFSYNHANYHFLLVFSQVRRYFFEDLLSCGKIHEQVSYLVIKIILLMKYKLILPYFLLLILLSFAHAQNRDSIATLVSHSVVSDSTVKTAASQGAVRVPDTTKTFAAQKTDSLSVAATKPVPASQNQPQKLKLLKRKYNSRQQVLLATGMMIFVIGIMTMAQQWNPR